MQARGVTLLELIATLSIGAILMGTAALGLRDLRDRWQLQHATRQVVLDLRLARLAAIAEGRSHALRFEPSADGYWREVHPDGGGDPDTTSLRTFPPGVIVTSCTARNGSISFRPRGNAASFGTITLQGHAGELRSIVVDMVGRVRVRR
jgi:prepilin-type N-terminal cleavage/methylation domain-containing protein